MPYTELDELSAFASVFQARGIEWARWVVGVGALCAMFSALAMNLYCTPRSIYAMASDGLLFSCLSTVNSYFRVPIYATLFAMFFVTIPATFVPLPELVEFISIGVLLGYAFVAGAMILLRYGPDILREDSEDGLEMPSFGQAPDATNQHDDNSALLDTTSAATPGALKHRFRSTPVLRELGRFDPGSIVRVSILCSVFFTFCTLALVEHATTELAAGEWVGDSASHLV